MNDITIGATGVEVSPTTAVAVTSADPPGVGSADNICDATDFTRPEHL
jgi:hypothetical protein